MSTPDAFDREYIALETRRGQVNRRLWIRRSYIEAIGESKAGPFVVLSFRIAGARSGHLDVYGDFDDLSSRLQFEPYHYVIASSKPGQRYAVRSDVVQVISLLTFPDGKQETGLLWYTWGGVGGPDGLDPVDTLIDRFRQALRRVETPVDQDPFVEEFVELEMRGYVHGNEWSGWDARKWLKRSVVLGVYEDLLDSRIDLELLPGPVSVIEVSHYIGRTRFLAVAGAFDDVLERLPLGRHRYVMVDSRPGHRVALRPETLGVISSPPNMNERKRNDTAMWAGDGDGAWGGLGGHVDPAEVVIERLRQAMGEG